MAPGLRAVFCGINPGLRAAAIGHHFAGRGNRFWRTLHLAGITPTLFTPENDRDLLRCGYGLTTAAARPTARAEQIPGLEIRAAANELAAKIESYAPGHVAFLGKQAYAVIARRAQLEWGRQPERFGGAGVWLLPNPSGLNRAFSLERLVEYYRAFRVATEQGLHEQSLGPSAGRAQRLTS
jgi:TDG/mug DNA glycosylase family protein